MVISSTLALEVFGETRALVNSILEALFVISFGWQTQGSHGQC
jgi:hypothetical protein